MIIKRQEQDRNHLRRGSAGQQRRTVPTKVSWLVRGAVSFSGSVFNITSRGSGQFLIAKIFSLFINYQTENSRISPPIEGLDNQNKGNTDSRPRLLLPSPDACPSNAPGIIVLKAHRDSEILPCSLHISA
jgi:hypothetical protein